MTVGILAALFGCLLVDPTVVPRTALHPNDDIAGRNKLVVTSRGALSPLLTFAVADTQLNAGLGAVAQGPGDHFAVGAFLYGEALPGSRATAWGANILAATMSAHSHAVGLEVNALNRATEPGSVVYGIHVVNGGVRETTAGIVVETSAAEPTGIPQYGVWVKEGSVPGAASAGVRIDRVSSGVALQVESGQCLVLGRICLRERNGKLETIPW
ncbi:MAG: hypothetical protein NZ578_08475 [Candidatus Binatia bacterium]|nr:hypothetical protein [Candidatus Binatia bacterium]